jgi:hypothetical protein
MTSKISSIPTEILHQILDILSNADLRSMCLVSRRCQELAQSRLYYTIEKEWNQAGDSKFILLLLRSILERPGLQSHINVLRLLVTNEFFFREQDPQPLRPDEDTLSRASQVIRVSGIPLDHQQCWIQGLNEGNEDAFLALLLSQLTEIKRLVLSYKFWRRLKYIGMMFRAALNGNQMNSLSKFRYLEDVSCRDSFHMRQATATRNTRDLLAMLYLPKIKRFTATIDNPSLIDSSMWVFSHKPDPSTLTSLHLMHIREPFLAEILSKTRALKSLRWEWFYLEDSCYAHDPIHGSPMVDLDHFMAAVEQVHPTLRELTLYCWIGIQGWELDYPGIKIEGSLKPLAKFEKLRTFEAPLPFVVGSTAEQTMKTAINQVIPPSLQNLRISDDVTVETEGNDNDNALFHVIFESWLKQAGCKETSPELTLLTLITRDPRVFSGKIYDWGIGDSQEREIIKGLCGENGISFEFIYEGWL